MNKPVLEAKSVSRQFGARRGLLSSKRMITAVDAVSFSLMPAETLGVVGESGSGKSTLARIVAALDEPTSGTVELGGMPLDEGDVRARRARRLLVQMVFQNPYGSLNPRKTIGASLAEPLKLSSNLNRAARKDAVVEALEKVGLRPDQASRYPHMFSGGQRQRVAIARALMLKPKVVVADEAVSALDVSVQAQILNLMMDLQDEFGLAYLFISHDLSVVRHISDRVLVMYHGRPVELSDKVDLFENPLHPYTRTLLSASGGSLSNGEPKTTSVGQMAGIPSSGCVFATRCEHATDYCRMVEPLPVLYGDRQVSCHRTKDFL